MSAMDVFERSIAEQAASLAGDERKLFDKLTYVYRALGSALKETGASSNSPGARAARRKRAELKAQLTDILVKSRTSRQAGGSGLF